MSTHMPVNMPITAPLDMPTSIPQNMPPIPTNMPINAPVDVPSNMSQNTSTPTNAPGNHPASHSAIPDNMTTTWSVNPPPTNPTNPTNSPVNPPANPPANPSVYWPTTNPPANHHPTPSTPKKQRSKDLGRDDRIRILTLRDEKLSYSYIASRIPCTVSQVRYVCQSGRATPQKQFFGRHPKLSDEKLLEIKEWIQESPERGALSMDEIVKVLRLPVCGFTLQQGLTGRRRGDISGRRTTRPKK